jgi:hypothetical protein
MKRVLNVGGGSKKIPIPPRYDGWEHVLLDIDPKTGADVVMDARLLHTLPPAKYDAVYCAHNLEHYYRHESVQVLRGFLHVLKPEGFAEIRVPDLEKVMKLVVANGLDIDDVLYQSGLGPILVRDVIYGYHVEIERSGNDFYAHKTGFTPKALRETVLKAGFEVVMNAVTEHFELLALAFVKQPTMERVKEIVGEG